MTFVETEGFFVGSQNASGAFAEIFYCHGTCPARLSTRSAVLKV